MGRDLAWLLFLVSGGRLRRMIAGESEVSGEVCRARGARIASQLSRAPTGLMAGAIGSTEAVAVKPSEEDGLRPARGWIIVQMCSNKLLQCVWWCGIAQTNCCNVPSGAELLKQTAAMCLVV